MAKPPRLDPHQADLFEDRSPLTTRREAHLPVTGALKPGLSVMRAALTPRQRARHFVAKASARRVRPAQASAGSRMRRVIVKARVVRMGPTARKALLTHVRYVERDGAGRDGEDERFFDRTSDIADGRAFAERCTSDRHHFRVIVNPEDGRELPDLKAYGRSFMAQVERDLGTEIDWIGGAHFDTGRPHLHLLLRGKREDGRDLVLPRDYVSHGLRSRAQELATELLGPRRERTELLKQEVKAEGFTALDRRLLGLSQDGRISMSDLPQEGADLLLRRLTHLEAEGFITRDRPGVWRAPRELRTTLQAAGERAARERAALKAVWASSLHPDAGRLQPLALEPGDRLVGAYVGFGALGSAEGPQALVLDLMDGRLAHLRLPALASLLALDRIPNGAVIEVRAESAAVKASDQTIAEIAGERGGVYSAEEHRLARPGDRDAFIERHVRRLEAMSREGACQALGGGRFAIGPDYEASAGRVDEARHGGATLQVRVLDRRTVAEQVKARAYTFLDRVLQPGDRGAIGAEGFGALVREMLPDRAAHLRQLGLASGDPLVLPQASVQTLMGQEVAEVFEALGRGGKPVFIAQEGKPFSGVYVDRVHISRGAYAVVEGPSAITLVPWREAIEACRAQVLTGVLTQGSVDFRFGQLASRGMARGRVLEL